MNNLAKRLIKGFGAVAYALNFGALAEPPKDAARYHLLLSGDLYQLHQDEEGSRILFSQGISLDGTMDCVGVLVPMKDKNVVKLVNKERVVEFYVDQETGKKILGICENDINDLEDRTQISLYGQAAKDIFRHVPESIKKDLDQAGSEVCFASLSHDDSPKLWYAFPPEGSKASELYRTEILSSSRSWEVKRTKQRLEPVLGSLRHVELTDDEHLDLLLKFIEGNKREYDEDGSNFFISEGRGVTVHDSISSIIAFNKKFIEGVYSFLPGDVRENLPDIQETESIFIYPSQGDLALKIEARDSYSIHLKSKDKEKLMNFLSKYGYTNPLKFKS